jgi:PKD repeat protein
MAEIVSWLWKFGDGETSQEENPIHKYNMAGVYDVVVETTLDDGRVMSINYTETVTDWSETAGEINGSHTNKSYQFAIKERQGIGLMERTGNDVVAPGARSGTLKVNDNLGNYRQLHLDANDFKWYHVSTRNGPSESGIVKVWPDKTTITTIAISGITLVSGSEVNVITSAAHGLITGDKVIMSSVLGTTEINNRVYTITVVDTTNFTLDGTDSDDYTAWTSGGTILRCGAFPIPKLKRPEDRGEQEHYFLNDVETHIYMSPDDESNRDASGFDSNGYPNDTQITLKAYEDSNVTEAKATALDANRVNEVIFQQDVYANRVQYEVSVNRPEVIFREILHYYRVIDEISDPDSLKQTEGTYDEELATSLLVWLSRNPVALKNLITGATLTGAASKITGPDSKSESAITISSQVDLENAAVSDGTLIIWHKTGYTISGVSLTQYNTIGSWIMSTATGAFAANLILGAGDVFDVRLFTDERSAAELLYYYNDINDNSGNNVLPLW